MAVMVPSAAIHSQIFSSTIMQIAPAGAALRADIQLDRRHFHHHRRHRKFPGIQGTMRTVTHADPKAGAVIELVAAVASGNAPNQQLGGH
jgi:hypothetical protein